MKSISQQLYPSGGHGGTTTMPPDPEQTFEESQRFHRERVQLDTVLTEKEKAWVLITALKMVLDDDDNFFFGDENKDMQAKDYIEKLIDGEDDE